MKIIPNTGRSLTSLIYIRSILPFITKCNIHLRIGYRIGISKPYTRGRVIFIHIEQQDNSISKQPLRIGVALTDFKPEMESIDVYPKPKNHI